MKHTVEEIELKNGAKGLLVNVPGATVMTLDFQLNAGDYLCSLEKVETAHLMEHMLFQANEKFSKGRDFQAELEKNGAMFNASTNTYSIHYYSECADFEWERIISLLGLAITKPVFKQVEFDAEYGNVKEELNMLLNDDFRQLALRLSESMGFFVQNENKRLKLMPNVNRRDIRDHYNKTHLSNNMRFVIAGKLHGRKSEILRILNREFKLPKGDRIALPKELPKKLDKVQYVKRAAVDNVYFMIDTYSTRQLGVGEKDCLAILNTLLTETMHSKILGEARERGLAYGMSSGLGIHPETTGWWMGAQVLPENAKELFKIIHKELDAVLRGKVTVAEIEAAKQYRLGEFQRGAQTVGGLASGYAGRYFMTDEYSNYNLVPDRIKAVNKKKLVSVARKMFEEDRWGIGVLGNCGREFAEELREIILPLWNNGEGNES